MFYSRKLKKFKDINHCFFSRNGGYSKGLFKSLNCGFGSSDNKKNIFKNDNSFTFGIGFDFGSSNFSLSFVQSTQNQNLQLFSAGLTDEYDLENKLTELTLSYNIKF